MSNEIKTGDRGTKIIRRIARIWSVPLILYALIMLIGYAYNYVTIGTTDPNVVEGTTTLEALPPIMMFVSIFGLAIAWRWELWGAAINILFQIVTIVLLLLQIPTTDKELMRAAAPFILVLLVIIPGILFLVYWRRSNRK